MDNTVTPGQEIATSATPPVPQSWEQKVASRLDALDARTSSGAHVSSDFLNNVQIEINAEVDSLRAEVETLRNTVATALGRIDVLEAERHANSASSATAADGGSDAGIVTGTMDTAKTKAVKAS